MTGPATENALSPNLVLFVTIMHEGLLVLKTTHWRRPLPLRRDSVQLCLYHLRTRLIPDYDNSSHGILVLFRASLLPSSRPLKTNVCPSLQLAQPL